MGLSISLRKLFRALHADHQQLVREIEMLRSFLKRCLKSFIAALLAPIEPIFANHLTDQQYLPAEFLDADRLTNIRSFFPEIDRIYQEFAKNNQIPGYSFGILLDGKLVHSGSGGFIDLKKKIPATTRSFFRIASMTKSFTALAIMKLRDEGKIRLDDPVSLYISELKKQQLTLDAQEITIRDLLTHSGGLPTDDPWADRKLNESDADVIHLIEKGIYFSNPSGTTFEYSNLGYTLLGYIITKISGMPYQKYIEAKIQLPLNMKEAAWEYSDIASLQLAHGYRWVDGLWQEEELLHDGIYGAMGGFITSIESFSAYAAMHMNAWPARNDLEKGPIKRSTIREMHQPSRFRDLVTNFKFFEGRESVMTSAYGYGLSWIRDPQGRVIVGHSGGLPGFGSHWCFMPEYGLGLVLFANATYAPANKANFEILERILDKTHLKPRQLPLSKVLKDRQTAFLKFFPEWENAAYSPIFAANFFLDNPLETLRKETYNLFLKIGKVVSIEEIIPETQLSGHFMIKGEQSNLEVTLGLTPENPSLIQTYKIKEI